MTRPKQKISANLAFLAAFSATWGLLLLNNLASPIFGWLNAHEVSAALQLGVSAIVSELGLVIPLVLVLGLGRVDLRSAFGDFSMPPQPLFAALITILGGGLLLDHLMFFAVSLFPSLRSGGLDSVGRFIASATTTEALILIVPLALIPSVCEEALCRGVVLRGLLIHFRASPWIAVLISSLFFGMLHLDRLHAPIAALMGLLLGFVAIRTGNIIIPILCHVLNNTVSILTPNLGGPSLTDVLDHGHSIWVVGSGAALLALGLAWLLRATPRWRDALLEQEEEHGPTDTDDGEQN